MATSVHRTINAPLEKLVAHLKTPLYRNGYALVLSSASTSGIGVIYWILAARLYPPAVVGLNSALISAMTFLAGIAQLNLMSALIRFIPTAGKKTRRFVLYTYLISLAAAVVASVVFLSGIHFWSPELSILGSSGLITLWFILATMARCIFVLQENVLTGLRRTTWVPVENTVYAVGKMALLIIFATSIPKLGIFASWTIALLISLVPVNALIFSRLIPRHMQQNEDAGSSLTARQVIHFAAPDYLGASLWLISTMLLPVIVTARLGASANAYFYLPWTIAYSLYLISPNIGSSLVVEASSQPSKLNSYSYKAFRQIARLVIPLAGLVIVFSPIVLRVFGKGYSAHGATLLSLLAASAIPNIITSLYVSIARVQRRMKSVVATLGAICVLVLGLSFILLPIDGIEGVGWAWLIGQSVVAMIIMITQLPRLWSIRSPLTDKDSWWNTLWQRPFLSKNHLIHLANRAFIRLHLFGAVQKPRDALERVILLAKVSRTSSGILKLVPAYADMPSPVTWVIHNYVRTVTDMTVVTLGPAKGEAIAVLKMPRSSNGSSSSQRQRMVLEALDNDPRLRDWDVMLPKIIAAGEFRDQPFIVEDKIPGIDGRRWLFEGGDVSRFLETAAGTIGELHQKTTRLTLVDDGLLNHWIDQPIETILKAVEKPMDKSSYAQPLRRLSAELHRELAGKTVGVSWTHGDYVPGNILLTNDGSQIYGIVDWELAHNDDLPMLDLMQLLLSTTILVKKREMGELVRRKLNGRPWTPQELVLIEAEQRCIPGDLIDLKTTLLLCWLRHIAGNLTKSTWYAGHWVWLAENFESVVQCL